MKTRFKIMIIGVDGATFDVIFPLIKSGLLPNFKRIITEGVHGNLRSTIHPITPHAWSTFLTGKNAGKHGVYDFTRRKKDSYDIEFINASMRNGDSLFMHLSKVGRKVGAIAIPFTYPPEPVNGFMLSGMDSPAEDERAIYPPELYSEIKKRFGAYHVHLASPIGRKRKEEAAFWRDIQEEDKNRTDISLYLRDKYPCDIFMTMYTNTDRVQHQYYTEKTEKDLEEGRPNVDSLLVKSYINVDKELGRLLEYVKNDKDTMVLLMSDHGSGPIRKFFYLNRWLEQKGFLVYREKSEEITLKTIEMGRYMAKRFLPRKTKNFLKTFLPGVKNKMESYRFFNDIDWSKTKAYGFGMYGNIFINLKGREPEGIVIPGNEYEDICKKLLKDIKEIRDPITDENIVDMVYRRADLYQGSCVEDAPDLLIGWKDYSFYTSNTPGREKGDCFGEYLNIDASDFLHVGTHRMNGIFMAMGGAIKKDQKIERAGIVDLAPTILYALGEQIPEDMDGRVLLEIFEPAFIQENPDIKRMVDEADGADKSRTYTPYTEEESEQVAERLTGLGYL